MKPCQTSSKEKHPRKGEKKKQRARTKVQASKHVGKGTTKYLNCTGKMTARFSTTELCGLGLCYLIATKQGVCRTVALPFTLKSILRQKKNYGNSTISPTKNIIFKKPSKINQNPSR
jgi:hypothetical protein